MRTRGVPGRTEELENLHFLAQGAGEGHLRAEAPGRAPTPHGERAGETERNDGQGSPVRGHTPRGHRNMQGSPPGGLPNSRPQTSHASARTKKGPPSRPGEPVFTRHLLGTYASKTLGRTTRPTERALQVSAVTERREGVPETDGEGNSTEATGQRNGKRWRTLPAHRGRGPAGCEKDHTAQWPRVGEGLQAKGGFV